MPRKLQPASAMSAVNRKMLLKGLSCPVAIFTVCIRVKTKDCGKTSGLLINSDDYFFYGRDRVKIIWKYLDIENT